MAEAAAAAAPEKSQPADEVERLEKLEELEKLKELEKEEARWRPVMALPCQLTVDLELPGVKVSNFLALHPGAVVSTNWAAARDVPLRINGSLVGWGELEAVGQRLAVRVTELA